MARNANPAVRAQIAANLQRIVGALNISVTEAAARVGLSQSQFSGYLRGHRGFAIETLLRLAAGLNQPIDELVRGVDVNYGRVALKLRYPELEDDLDLMDVLAGFEIIRQENPPEAAGIAAMFKARIPGIHAPAVAARYAAPSSAESVSKPRPSAAMPRRKHAGR